MCCGLLALAVVGPRLFNIFWWIFQPGRWELAFTNFLGGALWWWLWPVLGILLLPWTTLMYVLVSPGGLSSWDWLWLVIMFLVDIMSSGGGAGRKRVPGYEGR